MLEFISPKGKKHIPSHMAGYANLFDWCDEGQSKLCQVNEHFKYYLKS
jgi:hypothetical protein